MMQIIEGKQQLHLRQVTDYPDGIVSALTQLFMTSQRQVRRAFLLKCQEVPQITEYWLLALELDDKADESSFNDIAQTAMDFLNEEETLDICQLHANQSGMSHQILQHMQAFYQRRLGSFLRETCN